MSSSYPSLDPDSTRLPLGIATILALLALSGCTGISFKSGDALKTIYSVHVADLKEKYRSPGALQAAIQCAEHDPKGTARNALLNDFIFLIDNNYTFYEKQLYNKKAYSDFGVDVTSSTLSTLSGIVTGGGAQGAKSILSFIAGGLTAGRASFEKDILQSQNLLAIVARMRAQRSKKLIILQSGMYKEKTTTTKPLVEYSVDQGLLDVAAYYQAGTFISALQAIIDDAGKDKDNADKQVDKLKGIEGIPD